MRKLRDKLYKKIEKELEVKCPYFDCRGFVIKTNIEDFEQYTEDYWEKINYYRCTKNSKHVWKYIIKASDYLEKIKP